MGQARSLDKLSSKWDKQIEWMGQNIHKKLGFMLDRANSFFNLYGRDSSPSCKEIHLEDRVISGL